MADISNKITSTSGLFFTKNFLFFEKILPGSIRLDFFKYFQKKNVSKSATSLNKHDRKLLNLLKTKVRVFVCERFKMNRNLENNNLNHQFAFDTYPKVSFVGI